VIRRFLTDPRGAAGVEAALVAPVLLAVTMGSADMGTMLLERHKMKAGLAAGARLLAHASDPTLVEAAAKNLAVTGQLAGGAAVAPSWTTSEVTVSYRTVANPSGQYVGGAGIRIVRLQTSHIYTGFGMLRLVGMSSIPVSVAHEERWTGG
jgi:Flp pilus assembly protein TadG